MTGIKAAEVLVQFAYADILKNPPFYSMYFLFLSKRRKCVLRGPGYYCYVVSKGEMDLNSPDLSLPGKKT